MTAQEARALIEQVRRWIEYRLDEYNAQSSGMVYRGNGTLEALDQLSAHLAGQETTIKELRRMLDQKLAEAKRC